MLSAALFTLVVPAQTEAELFAPPPKPFVAPGRLFSVQVPGNWEILLTKDPYTINFQPQVEGDAFLSVRRIQVPHGASARQVMLHAIEQRLAKLPSWKLAGKKDVPLAGLKAARVTGTFAHQGNIQYPRLVEEVYVVSGPEAFVFHFECFEPYAVSFAPDLNKFYASFVPRPPGSTEPPPPSDQHDKLPAIDQVPF